jgi:hypothetical protein
VIAADMSLNRSALRNAHQMGLSEAIKDSFTYRDMPEEIPAFLMLGQKLNNQLRQRPAEKAEQNTGSGVGFASHRPTPPPIVPQMVPAGTLTGYTGPAPMDLSAGKRWISSEASAKRFVNGKRLHCGGFNHRAPECVAMKKAQMFMMAGAEIEKVGTKEGPEQSGKD